MAEHKAPLPRIVPRVNGSMLCDFVGRAVCLVAWGTSECTRETTILRTSDNLMVTLTCDDHVAFVDHVDEAFELVVLVAEKCIAPALLKCTQVGVAAMLHDPSAAGDEGKLDAGNYNALLKLMHSPAFSSLFQ